MFCSNLKVIYLNKTGLIKTSSVFFIRRVTRFSLNKVTCSKFGLIVSFFRDFWFEAKRMLHLFLTFSIVFSKQEFTMSLKTSFSKSVVAFVLSWVCKSIYGFIHAVSINYLRNEFILSYMPSSRYCFKFSWCKTYLTLSFKFGINFSTRNDPDQELYSTWQQGCGVGGKIYDSDSHSDLSKISDSDSRLRLLNIKGMKFGC